MLFYIIIGVLGLLFLILFITFIVKGNKLKVMNYKIIEAENDISNILNEKYDLLKNINEILKTKDKEDLLKDIESINIESINKVDLNKELSKYDKIIIELTDYNKEIVFDEEEEKVFDQLSKVNIDRLAVEKYYNDNASVFNDNINRFPSSIISKFKKYDNKDLFENEKEEIFEILKK